MVPRRLKAGAGLRFARLKQVKSLPPLQIQL
jgi:hypothetical protein